MKIKCAACGTNNIGDSVFCQECGSSFTKNGREYKVKGGSPFNIGTIDDLRAMYSPSTDPLYMTWLKKAELIPSTLMNESSMRKYDDTVVKQFYTGIMQGGTENNIGEMKFELFRNEKLTGITISSFWKSNDESPIVELFLYSNDPYYEGTFFYRDKFLYSLNTNHYFPLRLNITDSFFEIRLKFMIKPIKSLRYEANIGITVHTMKYTRDGKEA